jgi:hypothetical protein
VEPTQNNVELRPDVDIRMPDFARLGIACEKSYANEGDFFKAYAVLSRDAAHDEMDGNIVFGVFMKILESQPECKYSMSVGELYKLMGLSKPITVDRNSYWPGNSRGLGDWLAKNIPTIQKLGVKISERTGTGNIKMVEMESSRAVIDKFRYETKQPSGKKDAREINRGGAA